MRLLFVLCWFLSAAVVPVSALTIGKESLEEEIRIYVRQHYPDKEVKSISLSKQTLESAETPIRQVVNVRSVTKRHLYLRYQLLAGKAVADTLEATVRVETMAQRIVVLRDIAKEGLIRADDIRVVRSVDNGSRGYLVRKDEVIGKYARHNLRKGQALKRYHLHPEFMVHSRHRVKLRYASGAVRIELMGLALEDGVEGDVIRVKSVSGAKVMQCRVVGENKVEYVQ